MTESYTEKSYTEKMSRAVSELEDNPHCGAWAAAIACSAHICAAIDRLTVALKEHTQACVESSQQALTQMSEIYIEDDAPADKEVER